MDEYEKLEGELAEEYDVYLEKFRNLDFLEHELDVHNRVRAHRQLWAGPARLLASLQSLVFLVLPEREGEDGSRQSSAEAFAEETPRRGVPDVHRRPGVCRAVGMLAFRDVRIADCSPRSRRSSPTVVSVAAGRLSLQEVDPDAVAEQKNADAPRRKP